MSAPKDTRSKVEAAVQSCYSTWSERYYGDYYASAKAYPPVHVEIVRKLLRDIGANTLLDAGCGPASMLREFAELNGGRWGFDLTAEMVAEAQRVLASQGVPGEQIWQGSVLDATAYRPPADRPLGFDAALCFGVLPHIPEESDVTVLRNLRAAVRPGGTVIAEARNELFALFTMNRYSRAFFRDTLIREDELRARAGAETAKLDAALTALDGHFRMDLPPVRKGYSGEPGYDEVLSRTHNPFVLRAQAEEAGLVDTRVLFYHFHALPPMFEGSLPDLFRSASVAQEDPTDWRGHFMASAFILVGRRPG